MPSTKPPPSTELDDDWACEPERVRFSHPYSTYEGLVWIWNRFFGPSRKHAGITDFLPSETVLQPIEKRFTLAFLGDVMPGEGKKYRCDSSLHEFLADADYLVTNLEGVISDDDFASNGVRHKPWIVDFLAELFPPEKTVLTMANNHSADCGWEEFQRCYEELRERGFLVCGRRDEPWVRVADEVIVANYTAWSNHPGEFFARLEDLQTAALPDAALRVLSPHWGYEMQLYPNQSQIELGRSLLDGFDMIVGHHSHCPQPITQEDGRLVAYSTGNFCRGDLGPKFYWGLAMKTEVGPVEGQPRWGTGRVDWRFVHERSTSETELEVFLTDDCPYFPGLSATRSRGAAS